MSTRDHRSAERADLTHQAYALRSHPSNQQGCDQPVQQVSITDREDSHSPSGTSHGPSVVPPSRVLHNQHTLTSATSVVASVHCGLRGVGPVVGASEAIPRFALSELTDPFQQEIVSLTNSADTVPQDPENPREIRNRRYRTAAELSQFEGVTSELELLRKHRNSFAFEAFFYSVGSPTRRADRDLGISDLLPGKLVTAIVDSLAQVRVGRNQSQSERWRRLLEHATKNNGFGLGFIEWGQGGTHSLAKALSVPQKSLSRDICKWTDSGLIVIYWNQGQGGEVLCGIHIPLLTEWLVWLSSNRYRALNRTWGNPTTYQIAEVLNLTLGSGSTVPPSLETHDTTARFIEKLKSQREYVGRIRRKRSTRTVKNVDTTRQ